MAKDSKKFNKFVMDDVNVKIIDDKNNRDIKKRNNTVVKQNIKLKIFFVYIYLILAVIITIFPVFCLFLNIRRREKDINTQISEFENSENGSEIYERYIMLMTEYLRLRKSPNSDSVDEDNLSNIEQQIDDINTNISDLDKKVEYLIDVSDKSNNNTIISSVITGLSAIIAAIIAGVVAIKVAKMKADKDNL